MPNVRNSESDLVDIDAMSMSFVKPLTVGVRVCIKQRRSSLGVAKRALGIASLAGVMGGCFPYRETYRPMITGVVVDETGAPVAGAPVETCSVTHWGGIDGGDCDRRFTTVTAADGTFAVPHTKEIDWCCLGEAPRPRTLVSVCLPDGRLGGAAMDSSPHPVKATIPVSPPGSLSLAYEDGWPAEPSARENEVKSRCAARSGIASRP